MQIISVLFLSDVDLISFGSLSLLSHFVFDFFFSVFVMLRILVLILVFSLIFLFIF